MYQLETYHRSTENTKCNLDREPHYLSIIQSENCLTGNIYHLLTTSLSGNTFKLQRLERERPPNQHPSLASAKSYFFFHTQSILHELYPHLLFFLRFATCSFETTAKNKPKQSNCISSCSQHVFHPRAKLIFYKGTVLM